MSWFNFGRKAKKQQPLDTELLKKELEKELETVESQKASEETQSTHEPEALTESVHEPMAEEIVDDVVGPEIVEQKVEEAVLEEKIPEEPAPKPKKSFFAKLKEGLSKTRTAVFGRLDDVFYAFKSVDEDLFEELEEVLITADIGVDTSVYIIDLLRRAAKEKNIKEPAELKQELKSIISTILNEQNTECNLSETPAVIMVIGVNGVGKTTSIGKMANYYKSQGKKVLLAAADTFRAAAIDQLEIWAKRADVPIVKHSEGSDPAAVVFDACSYAKNHSTDVLIVDTAGRLHIKKNLMDELSKISRVIDRELPNASRETLIVLDAVTGQNAISQAKEFTNAADITGIVLTKLDGTAKGGIIISVKKELGIPVKYIGVGEQMDDLQKFDAKQFVQALFEE